jgi:HD-like signal output (HDOD) protein
MFKKVIKKLFKSNPKVPTNYSFFEDSKLHTITPNTPQPEIRTIRTIRKIRTKNTRIYSKEEIYQNEFYSFLFGKPDSELIEEQDELSLVITKKIEIILSNPNIVLNVLPIMPQSLTQLVGQLDNKDFDTDIIINLLQEEPIIAAKVLKLANSSFYNRNAKEIVDLKSAFMQLGKNGLSEGVINGFVSQLVPQSNIYFKLYGKKIWEHSLSTGIIAKQLIENASLKHKSAEGYLIGLICHLGDAVIYQLLIEAFAIVNPDCQPSSSLFKDVMRKKSKRLTYYIAKSWGLPTSILNVLAIQVKLNNTSQFAAAFDKHSIACYIHEASIISELKLRLESETINKDYINEVKLSLLFTKEAAEYVDNLLSELELLDVANS